MIRSKGLSRGLTVGDLFCGAGGFSEGFEQAGFRVAWGLDNWPPAAKTFAKNHPGARVYEQNIMSLDPRDLDPVDVLIGSPPCVHFSLANRGGNGDRAFGMKLVRRFLTFVRALRPKYWVMENVPALLRDLEAEMSGSSIELHSGGLTVPRAQVLDAAEFATPQARRRLYSGDFPLPVAVSGVRSSPLIPLRRVVETLPDPTRSASRRRVVQDPVYPGVKIHPDELRDHFEDTRWRLSEAELRTSERQKLYHAVYGKMSFPDDLDRPSRTITATRTRGSRSTIVVPFNGPDGERYRTLTLRESASAQGFPITYQFWATSMSDKDGLVGNAVPPTVARAIAHGILQAEGQEVPTAPFVDSILELPPALSPRRNSEKRFSMRRRFRGILPVDWRHDHRVELDNEFPKRAVDISEVIVPPVRWKARLYLGYATEYRCYQVELPSALGLARSLVRRRDLGVDEGKIASLLIPTLENCLNGFPDGSTLQARWCGRERGTPDPDSILSMVSKTVSKTFLAGTWREARVPMSVSGPTLAPLCVARGKLADVHQPLPMSVRLAAGTICLAAICERLNRGSPDLALVYDSLASGEGLASRQISSIISHVGAPPRSGSPQKWPSSPP